MVACGGRVVGVTMAYGDVWWRAVVYGGVCKDPKECARTRSDWQPVTCARARELAVGVQSKCGLAACHGSAWHAGAWNNESCC